jgi:hypothetical protein
MDDHNEGSSTLRFRRKTALAPEPLSGGDHYRLQGELLWLLEGERDEIAVAEAALGRLSTHLTAELLEINFGNTVGFVRVPGLLPVEIVSGKWDRAHFDQMLAELTLTASALPFTALGSGALPYDRSAAEMEEVLYHAFVYLRHVLSDAAPVNEQFLSSLNHVLRDPHRRLERTRERVPLERAHRVSTAALTRLATGQEELVEIRGGPFAALPLARALRGHLPTSVENLRIEPTCDTPENRFVKAFLDQALAIVRRVSDLAHTDAGLPGAFAANLCSECDQISNALGTVRRHPMWREVGPMIHLPAGSTVLQRRRGYREVYWHFGRLRQVMRIPLELETLRCLLEIRDIAQLYELWCYFSLVQIISNLMGVPVHFDRPRADDFGLTVQRDFAVSWPTGVRLFYNASYSRSRPTERRSYSVPLRPDIALEVRDGCNRGLHLFDAKFKLDKLTAWDSEEESEERFGMFKRGDLYKMHTYRDAIPRARSVWVLYPGTETRFYSTGGDMFTSVAPGQAIELDGVGAVPLLPDGGDSTTSQMGMLLSHLIAHA